jgi:hypothetical protein
LVRWDKAKILPNVHYYIDWHNKHTIHALIKMQISKPQQDETIQTTIMCKMAKTKNSWEELMGKGWLYAL